MANHLEGVSDRAAACVLVYNNPTSQTWPQVAKRVAIAQVEDAVDKAEIISFGSVCAENLELNLPLVHVHGLADDTSF